MYSECFKCSCWFTALASLQTCLQPQRNTAACEGSFKSTTVEKTQKFCSQRPGNWLPLLRSSSNHSDLLATSLMSFYNCVHAIQCMRAVTLQPLKCAPFFGSCVFVEGLSHPQLKADQEKRCETFCSHSHWQEGKGWEHQRARLLSPCSLF